MRIAFDVSPLKTGHYLQHSVRGSGMYVKSLKDALLEYFPDQNYYFFSQGEKLPKDIDIIHIPYFEPFFLTLPFRKKYKTVVTVHDLTPQIFPDDFPSGIKGRVKWVMQKRNLRQMDGIITDSDSSREDIARIVGIPKASIQKVYLAADPVYKKKVSDEKKHAILGKYHLPSSFVLYVGDATANKNLPRLLNAVIQSKIPLVMVGKALVSDFDTGNAWNRDLAIVASLAQKENSIYRLGFVPLDDLVTLYHLASAFVMPSLYEGFGLPILEAMCSGCPVVTSSAGSLKEVAADAAYIVDPTSVNSIAEGIKKVFFNRSLQKQLSDKGREQSEKFSWKKTAAETINVYQKIVEHD